MSARTKTTWRYCVSRDQLKDGGLYYSIREVYTAADGSLSWTEDSMLPSGETHQEIAEDLALMSRAIGGKVLDLTLDPPSMVSPIGVDR